MHLFLKGAQFIHKISVFGFVCFIGSIRIFHLTQINNLVISYNQKINL